MRLSTKKGARARKDKGTHRHEALAFVPCRMRCAFSIQARCYPPFLLPTVEVDRKLR